MRHLSRPASAAAPLVILLLVIAIICTASCSGSSGSGGSGGGGSQPILPNFNAASFTAPTNLTNPLSTFPVDVARVSIDDDGEDVTVTVTERMAGTRAVMGVACAIVRERDFEDDLLDEETEAWIAQDDAGNVWLMSESVTAYEYDSEGVVTGTNTEGSWEAGTDPDGTGTPAAPGYVIPASPAVGDFFVRGQYANVVGDRARVMALAELVELENGMSLSCVRLELSTSLDPADVDIAYVAPGMGLVRETSSNGLELEELRGTFDVSAGSIPTFSPVAFSAPEQLTSQYFTAPLGEARVFLEVDEDDVETIVIERVPGTRNVMGIDCAIIRDRVFYDGNLIEDTHDWFAQDDAGNVWYMGEEVVNYEYDEDGNLLGTNTEGSWEAGQDPAGVGSTALPGYLVPAAPVLGMSFFQEYYETEAIDMGIVEATDA